MNKIVIDWFDAHLTEKEVRGRRVLDVGSRNVNGSVRDIIMAKGAAEYAGVDLRPGPGVDLVCDAGKLAQRFGASAFDIVVSACTLEHVRDLPRAVSNIKHVCCPGGLILIAVPSRWPRHDYPGDYWRFTLAGLGALFGDCAVLQVAGTAQSDARALVFGKFRKPEDWQEQPGILRLGI